MRHNRLFLLFIFYFSLLGLSQIAAQDETPTLTPLPTETLIPTLPPTETATEIPSETPLPTDMPTVIPTPIPSETPTETAVLMETATDEASLTPTETATAAALPTEDVTLTPSSTTETETATASPSATETATSSATPTQNALASMSQSIQALQATTGIDIAYMDGVNFAANNVQVLDGNGNNLFTAVGGFPEWSITGTQLAYLAPTPQVNRHNFNTGVTEVLGGSTSLILPRINGTFWDPVWSPINSQMAFVWSRSTDRVDIYVMNVDGTNVKNLTMNGTDLINFLPVWSPDGQWIAFTSTDSSATSYKLHIVRADGTGSIIDVPTAPVSATLPFWAGDGSQLAFWAFTSDPTNPSFAMVSFTSSTGAIGTVQPFNPTASADWGRVWTPDSSQYAYMTSFDATAKSFQLLYSGDSSLIGTGWFPKWRPTYTSWSVTVSPDALIPPIAREARTECPDSIDNTQPEQGIACALIAYAKHGALTWADLVAYILHGEGNVLLTSGGGCTNNTFPGKPAPTSPPPAPTPTPVPIPVPVNFVESSCDPVQNEFVYAVVEQMFNLCDDPLDVEDNKGQCNEEGLLHFLGQVERYREDRVSDSATYQTQAFDEITNFLNGANGRIFGRCPCTTGNVGTIDLAKQGQKRLANDPYYAAYLETDYPGFWYSYSYFDNVTMADSKNRYLKIY